MSSLLVIGNGFDLKLGAKTQYRDFFESPFYSATKSKTKKWIEQCKYYNKTGDPPLINMFDFDFTVWDLLFYLVSSKWTRQQKIEEIKWCDIESVIHDSLVHRVWINEEDELSFSWEQVIEMILDNSAADSTELPEKAMALYITNQYPNCLDLYTLLLDELIKFEKSFGCYIRAAVSAIDYQDEAEYLVNNLCDSSHEVYVDSFNYSDFCFRATTATWTSGDKAGNFQRVRRVRHINGNCENPIFGIDLTEEEKTKHPECIRFTKTSRRLQQDSHHLTPKVKELPASINYAVVFGHSLNEMDYDYFNYLFTMLGFNSFELNTMGCIEFVYSVYKPMEADEIRSNYANKIHKLVDYYEGYISGMNRKILANFLRFSGKLKIVELQQ